MKIIKRGIPKNERTRELTCYSCDSILEITDGDILHMDDKSVLVSYVKCPVCKEFIYDLNHRRKISNK